VTAHKSAIEKEGAQIEFIAPQVGGVEASDGTWIEADEKIDGGPSLLYDAVLILTSVTCPRQIGPFEAGIFQL